MKTFMTIWTKLRHMQREEGAGMVEYALLVAFIAIVALVGVKLLGTALNDLFSTLSTSI